MPSPVKRQEEDGGRTPVAVWERQVAPPGPGAQAVQEMPVQSALAGAASTVSPAIFHWPSTFSQSSCFLTVSR